MKLRVGGQAAQLGEAHGRNSDGRRPAGKLGIQIVGQKRAEDRNADGRSDLTEKLIGARYHADSIDRHGVLNGDTV
jgi:hypothetical protein